MSGLFPSHRPKIQENIILDIELFSKPYIFQYTCISNLRTSCKTTTTTSLNNYAPANGNLSEETEQQSPSFGPNAIVSGEAPNCLFTLRLHAVDDSTGSSAGAQVFRRGSKEYCWQWAERHRSPFSPKGIKAKYQWFLPRNLWNSFASSAKGSHPLGSIEIPPFALALQFLISLCLGSSNAPMRYTVPSSANKLLLRLHEAWPPRHGPLI